MRAMRKRSKWEVSEAAAAAPPPPTTREDVRFK